MKAKRTKFTAAFKAKVALEAIRNQKTLAQLSEEYKVSANTIIRWKNEFVENAALAFSEARNEEGRTDSEQMLYEKIGRLEMKLDFAKRASEKLGIPVPADF